MPVNALFAIPFASNIMHCWAVLAQRNRTSFEIRQAILEACLYHQLTLGKLLTCLSHSFFSSSMGLVKNK